MSWRLTGSGRCGRRRNFHIHRPHCDGRIRWVGLFDGRVGLAASADPAAEAAASKEALCEGPLGAAAAAAAAAAGAARPDSTRAACRAARVIRLLRLHAPGIERRRYLAPHRRLASVLGLRISQ